MSVKIFENRYENKTIVRTSRVIVSFPSLFERDKMTGKFGTTLLIDKEDTELVKAITTAIANAKEDGKTRVWGGKIPKGLKEALHDGDDTDYEGYGGHYYINARSENRITVYGPGDVEIDDEDEVYPGCLVQAFVEFKPYDKQSKGITCTLVGIKKVADGERLGGGGFKAGADDFDDDGDEDDLGL